MDSTGNEVMLLTLLKFIIILMLQFAALQVSAAQKKSILTFAVAARIQHLLQLYIHRHPHLI